MFYFWLYQISILHAYIPSVCLCIYMYVNKQQVCLVTYPLICGLDRRALTKQNAFSPHMQRLHGHITGQGPDDITMAATYHASKGDSGMYTHIHSFIHSFVRALFTYSTVHPAQITIIIPNNAPTYVCA